MSIIRSMTAEDAAKVASLEAEIFSQPWSENAFLDSLCLPDTIFLVAEESGVIQGYIGMYLAADEGEITNVAVNPACRRRGIGEGLLTEMKKRAADPKIARIVLALLGAERRVNLFVATAASAAAAIAAVVFVVAADCQHCQRRQEPKREFFHRFHV